MIEKVIKRDGSTIDYSRDKIWVAMSKANIEVKEKDRATVEEFNQIISSIENSDNERILIEDIQNIIEKQMMEIGKYNLAKAYITYRYKRDLVRKSNTTDNSIMNLLNDTNEELAKENSNKNHRLLSTQRDYIAGEVSKDLAKRIILPKHIVEAHESGILHFHDLDYFIQPMFNCCLVNIKDMFDKGTVMNGKMVESPKSFQVACTVMTQIIASVSNSQLGGQSIDISCLGEHLWKNRIKIKEKFKEEVGNISNKELDNLVEMQLREELKAGIQTIQYQILTLSSTNGQAPFVTLFLNLKENDVYKKETAMIIEEILNQRLLGIKNEYGVYITPAFPKLVYVVDEHNNLTGGEYDWLTKLAAKCSAKRMYPDYISAKKMRENYEGNVFSPMGCRSFLSPWKDANGNYKFEGRFNQGVVTINLPQIGLICHGDLEAFEKEFDRRVELCYEALMCKNRELKKAKPYNAPIHWKHGGIARLENNSDISTLLENGYSTISLGYIGLYELTKIMTGESHTTKKGEEFALYVMNKLNEKVNQWKEKTGIGFALYGTPAESLCYRFANIDKKKYGSITDITDKDYYTNSYHVDVREDISVFDKFKFESQFQSLSKGGCISYVEVPNLIGNPQAIEEIIKYAYETTMYFEFNTKSDHCGVCQYDGEILINNNNEWECPNCGNNDRMKLSVCRRT